MKKSRLILATAFLSGIFFTTACTTVTRSRLTTNFSAVAAGMSEKEVIALLGMPERRLSEFGSPAVLPNRARWVSAEGPEYNADYVQIDVTFDQEWRVVSKKILSYRSKTEPPESQLQWTKWNRDLPKGVDQP